MMSRSSWWSLSYSEYDFNPAPKINPMESSKSNATERQSPVSGTSNISEACPSKVQDNDAPKAIPIPQNQNSGHDERKNRSSSLSWWSSSSNGRSPNSVPEEKHISNSTSRSVSPTCNNDKDRQGHSRANNNSSTNISSQIKETKNENKKSVEKVPSGSIEKEHEKSQNASINVGNADEHIVNKSSDLKSSSWWVFGNHSNNGRSSGSIDATINIDTKTIVGNQSTSDISQIKETSKDADTTKPQPHEAPDQSKNSIISHTPPISDGENRSSSVRVRVRKSSSETKRWSLFGTWSSSSTSNLLENGEKFENKKANNEASSTESNIQSSSSTSSTSSSSSTSTSSSTSSLPNTIKSPSKDSPNPINPQNKEPATSHPKVGRRQSNPLVESLAGNRQSWLQFFTNGPPAQTNIATIEKSSSIKMITDGKSDPLTSTISDVTKVTTIAVEERKTKPVVDTPTSSPSPKLKPVPVNVVLPMFDEFVVNKPRKIPNSPIQQALHAINSYFFPPDKPVEGSLPKWLDEITRSTVDVRRIAIIGVHGWFPAKFLRAVVGQPTGTSPKFCDMMAKALLGYLSQHNISLPSDAITCIPLEGEGTIDVREKLLYKNLMYNKTWCEALSLADVVFVATHSQGTPVSTILLSRLIKERLVNPGRQRICMLAMAGISHGPFPYLLKHYLVTYFVGASDAARELFEFMDTESIVSKKYHESLNVVIKSGVKIVYVASLDDQVVPLYSGLFMGLNHPSVMRAIYIDGPLYQETDFLTNLIVFAIRLRNAGIIDHGLIVQLSEVAAGPMYGEGHSNLYTEIDVYTLAVRYLFETSSLGKHEVKLEKFQAPQKNNPSYLPWAMRGILGDRGVTGNQSFLHEVNLLRKQYKEWEPTSKVMKDIKHRLEPFTDIIIERARL